MSTVRRATRPTEGVLDDQAALARVCECIDATRAQCTSGFAQVYLGRLSNDLLEAVSVLSALHRTEPVSDPPVPVVSERRSRFSAGARIRGEDSV